MKDKSPAFSTPIPEGLIRILLGIDFIECEVENDAPDFLDAREDSPRLMVKPETEVSELTDVFLKSYPLKLNTRKSEENKLVWELEQEGIWFDIAMENVKDIWLSDFDFFVESEKPRYLVYYIKDVEHHIEWLQTDEKTGEIRSLSDFKKKFRPPQVSGKDIYSGAEILKCADMLGRAIKKIDIRTGGAMIKFNTEKGRLNPLLTGMAEKLGYKVEALDKETIARMEEKGENVSHTITLN